MKSLILVTLSLLAASAMAAEKIYPYKAVYVKVDHLDDDNCPNSLYLEPGQMASGVFVNTQKPFEGSKVVPDDQGTSAWVYMETGELVQHRIYLTFSDRADFKLSIVQLADGSDQEVNSPTNCLNASYESKGSAK